MYVYASFQSPDIYQRLKKKMKMVQLKATTVTITTYHNQVK